MGKKKKKAPKAPPLPPYQFRVDDFHIQTGQKKVQWTPLEDPRDEACTKQYSIRLSVEEDPETKKHKYVVNYWKPKYIDLKQEFEPPLPSVPENQDTITPELTLGKKKSGSKKAKSKSTRKKTTVAHLKIRPLLFPTSNEAILAQRFIPPCTDECRERVALVSKSDGMDLSKKVNNPGKSIVKRVSNKQKDRTRNRVRFNSLSTLNERLGKLKTKPKSIKAPVRKFRKSTIPRNSVVTKKILANNAQKGFETKSIPPIKTSKLSETSKPKQAKSKQLRTQDTRKNLSKKSTEHKANTNDLCENLAVVLSKNKTFAKVVFAHSKTETRQVHSNRFACKNKEPADVVMSMISEQPLSSHNSNSDEYWEGTTSEQTQQTSETSSDKARVDTPKTDISDMEKELNTLDFESIVDKNLCSDSDSTRIFQPESEIEKHKLKSERKNLDDENDKDDTNVEVDSIQRDEEDNCSQVLTNTSVPKARPLKGNESDPKTIPAGVKGKTLDRMCQTSESFMCISVPTYVLNNATHISCSERTESEVSSVKERVAQFSRSK